MDILIIGNGFDLAHKLPTQYSDFLGFIKAYKDADTSLYSGTIPELKDNDSIQMRLMHRPQCSERNTNIISSAFCACSVFIS